MKKFTLKKGEMPVAFVYYFHEKITDQFVCFVVEGGSLKHGIEVHNSENQNFEEFLHYIANINGFEFDNYEEI